ncbi:unnamed protein product [Camellia sinensis]
MGKMNGTEDLSGIPSLIALPTESVLAIGLNMCLVESKGGAIACMLLALFFLGTWPAILILLERRGRLPQHTYLDYTMTNLLAAVIIAFTFGEIGTSTAEEPNFLTQLSQVLNCQGYLIQDNWPSVLFAMAGGVVLSLGNLATQYSLAFVGLSVTEVITASITVVIVCPGSAVHTSNAADNKAKLSIISNDDKTQSGATDVLVSKETHPIIVETKDPENGSSTAEKAKFGSAGFLIELENRRAIKVFGKSTMIGLGITFFAGICFSLFSPAFNLATNDQWHTLKDGVAHLTVHIYSYIHYSIISEDGSGSAVGNAIAGPEVGKCLVWREEIDTGLGGTWSFSLPSTPTPTPTLYDGGEAKQQMQKKGTKKMLKSWQTNAEEVHKKKLKSLHTHIFLSAEHIFICDKGMRFFMDPHSQNMDSEDEVEEPSATPLRKYVTKVPSEASSAKPGGGGSMKFICNFGL